MDGRTRRHRPLRNLGHRIATSAALIGLLGTGTIALGMTPAAASATAGPVVATQSGLIQAAAPDASGVTAFEGIPYAAPPVGALRWKPPQPAQHWSGVLQTTAYGPSCWGAQLPGTPTVPMSENCLSLNVWMPPKTLGPPKAVMVWLEGGGFQFGTSAGPLYNGANLAAHGVVVVTLNYRLGVFGFLARPDLDAEQGSSGDYGLQDQIAALRWVQADIAQFGGNPGNVTVFGQSAGADSVGLLMSSPQASGLFAKAIAESGAFWDGPHGSIPTHTQALARGQALSTTLNAPTLADLRAIPAAQLAAATAWTPGTDPIVTAFSPSVDGRVLRAAPAAAFAAGQQAHVPLLAGFNAAEDFPLFDPLALPHATPAQFDAAAQQLFGAAAMPRFQALYPAATEAQATASADLLAGDMTISEQTWQLLGLQKQTGNPDVYAYKFTYTSPYSPVAAHVAEVPFVFGNLIPQFFAPTAPPPGPADAALSATMSTYWTDFAKQGNPNSAGLPAWPVYAGPGSQVLDLDAAPGPITEPDTARLGFLASFRGPDGRFPASWLTNG
ncbi:MAG TPA: carboxylesterase family protein [Actinocrinis sp.]|nr:carboxylesterase family protein [Actinocrinis sp.]